MERKWKHIVVWGVAIYLISQIIRSIIVIAYGNGLNSMGLWGFRRMSHDCVGITFPPIIGWSDSFYGRGFQIRTDNVYCLGKDVWFGE